MRSGLRRGTRVGSEHRQTDHDETRRRSRFRARHRGRHDIPSRPATLGPGRTGVIRYRAQASPYLYGLRTTKQRNNIRTPVHRRSFLAAYLKFAVRRYKPLLDGANHRVSPVCRAELTNGPRRMLIHRSLSNTEDGRDLAGGLSPRNPAQHVQLSRGQQASPSFWRRSHVPGHRGPLPRRSLLPKGSSAGGRK